MDLLVLGLAVEFPPSITDTRNFIPRVFVLCVLSSLNVAIMSCLDLLKRDGTVKFKREQRFLPNLWYRVFVM